MYRWDKGAEVCHKGTGRKEMRSGRRKKEHIFCITNRVGEWDKGVDMWDKETERWDKGLDM
jgi:hypothetical protein